MNGSIYLRNLDEVAEFLSAWERNNSNAVFEVTKSGSGWAISFNK